MYGQDLQAEGVLGSRGSEKKFIMCTHEPKSLTATARSEGETVDSMTLLFLSLSLSLLFLLLAKCLKGLLSSPKRRERERERERGEIQQNRIALSRVET